MQLDFAAERNKVSMSNSEGYKKEISVLRDRLQKYTASVAKHEQTVNSQRQVWVTGIVEIKLKKKKEKRMHAWIISVTN